MVGDAVSWPKNYSEWRMVWNLICAEQRMKIDVRVYGLCDDSTASNIDVKAYIYTDIFLKYSNVREVLATDITFYSGEMHASKSLLHCFTRKFKLQESQFCFVVVRFMLVRILANLCWWMRDNVRE